MPHVESEEGWLSTTESISYSIPKVSFTKKGKPYWYLEQWRGREGNQKCEQVLRESREIGTAFHLSMEEYFNTSLITGESNIKRMMNNLINKFIIPFKVKAIRTEQTNTDSKLQVQGTYDAVITCDGIDKDGIHRVGEYTLDGKTGNSLDEKSGPLQLANYDYLRKGSGKGVLVRVDKNKDVVEIRWYENLQPYWKIYTHALKIARYVRFGLEDK